MGDWGEKGEDPSFVSVTLLAAFTPTISSAASGKPKNEWFISVFVRNELLITNTNGSSVIARIAMSTV
jgi:hypothetical protein